MTNDITAPLTELRAAYRAYQAAKRDKKEEIREKYETRIAEEVRAAVEAEKYAFATRLRDLKEYYGLNVTDIQDHVLRTRNWKVWEDIRDYADIQPEQITREKTRAAVKERAEAEARTHEFKDGVLYWYKWSDGSNLEHPFVINDYSTSSDFVYIPEALVLPLRDYGYKEFYNSATKAVKDAFTGGTIEPKERASKRYQAMEISTEEYAALQAEGERLNEAWVGYREGDK